MRNLEDEISESGIIAGAIIEGGIIGGKIFKTASDFGWRSAFSAAICARLAGGFSR
jgi:hypothetical protein